MKTLTIAVAQCALSCEGDVHDNVVLMDGWMAKAKATGAHVVAFPEASLSGYCPDHTGVKSRAYSIQSAPVRAVMSLSRKHAIDCAFGFYERDHDNIYNSYAIAGHGRLIGLHRKVHIPPREQGLFAAGSAFTVFDLPWAKVGLSICYDNEFPESHTCLALQGAEIIIMPAGWADHWEREDYIERCTSDEAVVAERRRWMQMMFGARCRDNGTYSVLVNHAGLEAGGPSRFVGKSMVFAPTGKVVSEARAWDEELLCVELDAQLLSDYRRMDAYTLRSRHPGAYGPIVDDTKGRLYGH